MYDIKEMDKTIQFITVEIETLIDNYENALKELDIKEKQIWDLSIQMSYLEEINKEQDKEILELVRKIEKLQKENDILSEQIEFCRVN